jgi:hypothetical protein
MRRLLLALLLASCAGAPPPVDLGAAWPQTAPDYRTAHQRWTRRGGHSDDWTRIVDVAATLKSPEWRAAWVRERARRQRLGPEAEAELAARERAEAGRHIEIELLVATARGDWNDLRKGKDSMWRVALVLGDGREIAPTAVREDRRPRGEIAAYFPDLQPFYNAYTVTFPPLIDEGTRQVTLKIASAVGAVELAWREI